MKPSRGYLIDPYLKTIRDIVVRDYDEINKLIGDTYAIGSRFDNDDTLFVDDSGLLKDNQSYFCIDEDHRPLAGYGVMLGTDYEGECVDVKTSIFDFINMVYFPIKEDVEKFLRETDYLKPKITSFNSLDELFGATRE